MSFSEKCHVSAAFDGPSRVSLLDTLLSWSAAQRNTWVLGGGSILWWMVAGSVSQDFIQANLLWIPSANWPSRRVRSRGLELRLLVLVLLIILIDVKAGEAEIAPRAKVGTQLVKAIRLAYRGR